MAIQNQSSQHSTSSKAALIVRQVRVLFSAYRRADFADPEGFIAQLGIVLEDYSDAVIIAVTHPRTGLQRRSEWPPSIAKVVEACEAESAAIATSRRLAEMRPTSLQQLPHMPQHRANVYVPADNALFPSMVDRARGGDEQEYRYDDRGGIWVALGWLRDDDSARPTVRRFNAADLQAIYARNDEAA